MDLVLKKMEEYERSLLDKIKPLPEIEHKFICGYKHGCYLKEYDNKLQHDVCKTDNVNCMYLCPF